MPKRSKERIGEDAWPELDAEASRAEKHKHEKIGILWRLYALIPIIGVVFLSYKALEYLVVALVFPQAAPRQITQIPKKLSGEIWETRRDIWSGVEVADNPRAPLAHYHHIDGWFQPDPYNDCTRSGCHNPMPHSRHKAVRAFLNMHATSIHCGVCHMKTRGKQRPLVWYDLQTGRATDPPALLQAYSWALSPEGQLAVESPTAEAQRTIVKLLRLAAKQADNLPDLIQLADQLHAVRYTSDSFKELLAALPRRLPLYFHGEYGAKLALRDEQTGQPRLAHAGAENAINEFLTRGKYASPAGRESMLSRVHTERRSETLKCTACHRQEDSLVDLSKVGYPQRRISSLYEKWIFRAIEHISEGRPLYLPGFIGPEGKEPPTTSEPVQQP